MIHMSYSEPSRRYTIPVPKIFASGKYFHNKMRGQSFLSFVFVVYVNTENA